LKSVGCVALTVDASAPRDSIGEFGRFFVSPEIDMYAALVLCHSYRSSTRAGSLRLATRWVDIWHCSLYSGAWRED